MLTPVQRHHCILGIMLDESTAEHTRHVDAYKVCTASQHWRLYFRDIVERTLPVLLGGQWTNLQHHSLADKLQVSLAPCCSGSPLHRLHPLVQYRLL